MKTPWLALAWLVSAGWLGAEEILPPVPQQYFNDEAGVCRTETVSRLNAVLESFERETSNQILVAIYPRMTSDSSIEDFTVRVAEHWKVGQVDRDNGAVLFVFIQDRKMYLQVGYGLEGVLPDARAKQIIENEIVSRFRQGNMEAGLEAGVTAILASVRGEYTGTGRTVAEGAVRGSSGNGWVFLLIMGFFYWLMIRGVVSGGRSYTSGGRRVIRSGWAGGGFSGGGWGGGGGGGFSGGGGSFGGGGAGGSW